MILHQIYSAVAQPAASRNPADGDSMLEGFCCCGWPLSPAGWRLTWPAECTVHPAPAGEVHKWKCRKRPGGLHDIHLIVGRRQNHQHRGGIACQQGMRYNSHTMRAARHLQLLAKSELSTQAGRGTDRCTQTQKSAAAAAPQLVFTRQGVRAGQRRSTSMVLY
jgi:hypothetical protein